MEALNEENIEFTGLQNEADDVKIPSERAMEVQKMVFTPADIMVMMALPESSVYDLMKKALKTNAFVVIKMGRTYRVDKESFLLWYRNGGEC